MEINFKVNKGNKGNIELCCLEHEQMDGDEGSVVKVDFNDQCHSLNTPVECLSNSFT